jgi:hypothetical protein
MSQLHQKLRTTLSFEKPKISKQNLSKITENVDVLVAAGGIPSWTTFLREEEDSKKSKEDH